MRLPKKGEYPKELILGTLAYEVLFKHLKHNVGETDPNKKTISIEVHVDDLERFSTFIHEVLHMIDIEYGIKLKHAQIYALERALTRFFMDNF